MRPIQKSHPQTVRITCQACGERNVVHGQLPIGELTNVKVYHEDWCPFLAAIQSGRATAWLLKHGYPIAYQVVPT